jgi:hypothetical protein
VETNLFSAPSARLAALPRALRSTALFDYLLAVLRPRLLYVHGADAVAHLATRAGQPISLGKPISLRIGEWAGDLYATRHLSFQWRDSGVVEFAGTLRSKLQLEAHVVVA